MRITTQRTELLTEVYELPDELRTGTDADLLAEAERRVPVEGRRELQDDWVVVDRGQDDIEAAAAAYRGIAAEAKRAEERVKALVLAVPDDRSDPNYRSEHKLAVMLGIDRTTIRRWRGKA